MPRESIQPSGLLDGRAFALAQVVRSKGSSYVHVAGQTAIDEQGAPVGCDLATQIDVALENVRKALAGAGATPSDLVSIKTYIVDFDPEQLAVYAPAMSNFFDPENLPACSVFSISALAQPGLLVEIEAVAVLDD